MGYRDVIRKTEEFQEKHDAPTEEQVARAKKIGLTPRQVQANDRTLAKARQRHGTIQLPPPDAEVQ